MTDQNIQTIEITNFGGRLSRILNGEMNSGFAKFVTSFGYDPFSKPMNLTWLETPTDMSGSITDLVVAAKPRFESGVQFVYAVGSSGKLYKIQPNSVTNPNLDSVSVIGTIAANSPSFNFGASMEFYGDTEKIFVGSDTQINSINFDGSGDSAVGSTANYKSNVFRPLRQFVGKLLFGNGQTIGAVSSTGTITSSVIGMGGQNVYSELNPGLSVESRVTDLDISPDGNYALITASGINNEQIATVASDRQAAAGADGSINRWNGSDQTITSLTTIPSYAVTALQTYLQNNIFFSNDSFGSSLNDGTNKILTLPSNKSPFANSTLVNGNFVSWVCPEVNSAGSTLFASMYYFGSLDQENPPGLYRVMRYTTALAGGFVYQIPVNILTNNKYMTVNNAVTALITLGYGKHYFSTFEVNSSNTTVSATTAKLYRFLITPTGTGTPQFGVYETQTQLFSKRVTVKQIRVYTEATAASNGFQVDCIGSDGSVITNGTFNYTFVAGSDPTLLQGALQRVDFNPKMSDTFALGLRITNTGTVNMTIKKIEVDWAYSGK